ncbi:embryonic polarity protein dorsal-like isoform X4 [Diorhabda carinulata]|uniref:embryonic polarity protein dorsal-like isoform X4 n=1 Tax=Diorhabda sublineata TaxID=1163346 RepID=UPI0024E19398|nr:embryonic polarity protein dorsal-like isoform X4 [Diorhabda sublineata]XP_057651342.1 embryonic polarity protein dorsal-like isoform X4 [Diorhabda carinulata]
MDYHDLDTETQEDGELTEESIELSDVIEVIETDPDFQEYKEPIQSSAMFNGGGEIPIPQQPTANQASQYSSLSAKKQARIRIVEQPASKALRFRYECEGRSAGSIPGARSTPENKSYPTIRVEGYKGRAVVVVSCVTRDQPYRPHPHNLVGREGCKRGVCTLEIPTDTMTVHFSNLGIQCVKKKDIEHALRVREEIRVDPFRTGFSHRNQPTSIDLNVVRLCFQVFLEGDTPGKFSVTVPPVVSDPIYDKKAMSDLTIVKLSDCSSYVDGGRKDIVLLCEKVLKEDIQVRFFEENGDWEAFAEFQPSQVHKQHAIWFRTPKYKTTDVTDVVKVFIQLRRPSDGATSDALPFELHPIDSEPGALKHKRQKIKIFDQTMNPTVTVKDHAESLFSTLCYSMGNIKEEPRATPSPYSGSLSPYNVGIGSSPEYAPNILSPPQQSQINWNFPSTSTTPLPSMGTWNIQSNNNLQTNDSQQINNNLQVNDVPINLDLDNGAFVEQLVTIDQQSSLPNLSSLSDIVPVEDTNMTDSITKLVNIRINELTNLYQ